MKKLSLLIAALMLASCGGNPVSTKPSAEPSISPISISTEIPSEESSDSMPVIPSESITSESDDSSASVPSESSPDISSESSSEEPPIEEPMTPADAINELAYYFGVSPVEVDDGVYGLFAAFPAADYPADTMVTYAEMFTPEEFAAVVDWAVDEDNVHSAMYINDVDTVIEWYIYEDVVYVDGSGMIVEEPGEGISEVNATFIEIYTYTYVEPVEPELAPIVIDAAGLLGYAGSSISYGDGTATIDEINFSYVECAAYGNGIQMRTKNGKSSTIANIDELPAGIKSINIVLNADKQVYANEHALRFTFGESADALGNEVVFDTVADQYEYTINVPEGVNALFFQLVHGITYSLYVDSITLNF